MNAVVKLCRCALSHKTVCQRLYPPVCAVAAAASTVNPSKSGLCNSHYKPSRHKLPTVSLLLGASLLTWLGFAQDDEEKESELIMTIKRAILCTQREQWTKAEQMLHVALRLAQEQQNPQGVLYVYDLMANLALERGESDKAEVLFVTVLQRLLADGMKQDDIKGIHISLKLARICHMKGDLAKAEIGFQWCLDKLRQHRARADNADATALYAVVQDWYAQLLLDRGQAAEAVKRLQEALEICGQVEGEASEKCVLLLNDLGTASWKMGDLSSALDYLNRAIKLAKGLEEFRYLGAIYANLGLVYLEKGVLEQARRHCKEGWRLGKQQNDDVVVEQANYCFERIRQHV